MGSTGFGRKPCGLMFHYFHDGNTHPVAQGTVSGDHFEAIVNQFLSSGKMLRADEWASRAEANKLENGEVCVTFDDGLQCQIDVALPVLEMKDLTAFWFIQSNILTGEMGLLEIYRQFRNEFFPSLSDFYQAFFLRTLGATTTTDIAIKSLHIPGNYLKEFGFYSDEDRIFRYIRDQVLTPHEYTEVMEHLMKEKNTSTAQLAQNLFISKTSLQHLEGSGHIIGLHSHNHPNVMARLPYEEQRTEYETNHNVLCDLLVNPPFTVAHPCGSYNSDTLVILRELGIQIGFRSNMAQVNHSNLEFPRMDSADLLLNLGLSSSHTTTKTI